LPEHSIWKCASPTCAAQPPTTFVLGLVTSMPSATLRVKSAAFDLSTAGQLSYCM
jgi:hypothetical protein